jgi:hypothetical protein
VSIPDHTVPQDVLHIYISDHGRFLSTREAGKRTVRDFERLTRAPGDVILDFNGVEAATPPYLQELFDAITTLILAGKGNGRIVLAANLNDDLAETMRYVAAHAKRGVAFLQHNKLDLIEDRPQLAETLREAQRLKPFFTAPELAERLEINPDTATQRLKRLVDLGAAERRTDPTARQGVRHIYRVADPQLAGRAAATSRPPTRRRQPAAAA